MYTRRFQPEQCILFRDKLIDELPPLAPVASSEDDCLTESDELETPCMHRRATLTPTILTDLNEEYALDVTIPPFFSVLQHAVKRRAPRVPGQRKPTQFFKNNVICEPLVL